MKQPFEVPYEEMEARLDEFVTSVFSSLRSEFLVLPKGSGFIEYPVFERGYEELKRVTEGFRVLTPEKVRQVVLDTPISLIVLRSILGFTPPEWAYVASQESETQVSQGFVRTIDRQIRLSPLEPLTHGTETDTAKRLGALIGSACRLINGGSPVVSADRIHRLDKADTRCGVSGLQSFADLGAPYAMLLYERFLGRPFAGHRDSVSELVGDVLESAIEGILQSAGVTFRKTRRAERIEGFDQTPDFIIPTEFNPKIVIEAKITEDDGTARDKVTRIQHLGELSQRDRPANNPRFEVIACIAGRGFGVRREDMKKMLRATRGKVFTLHTLDRLLACTQLRDFATRGVH